MPGTRTYPVVTMAPGKQPGFAPTACLQRHEAAPAHTTTAPVAFAAFLCVALTKRRRKRGTTGSIGLEPLLVLFSPVRQARRQALLVWIFTSGHPQTDAHHSSSFTAAPSQQLLHSSSFTAAPSQQLLLHSCSSFTAAPPSQQLLLHSGSFHSGSFHSSSSFTASPFTAAPFTAAPLGARLLLARCSVCLACAG